MRKGNGLLMNLHDELKHKHVNNELEKQQFQAVVVSNLYNKVYIVY